MIGMGRRLKGERETQTLVLEEHQLLSFIALEEAKHQIKGLLLRILLKEPILQILNFILLLLELIILLTELLLTFSPKSKKYYKSQRE